MASTAYVPVEERLGTALALTVLQLAALGLYAVANLNVRQREAEMGVLLTLGATGRDLRRPIIRQTCRPVIAGALLGFAAACWTTKFLQRFLYEVQPGSSWYYAAVTAMLLATAVLAVWFPAWRASRLDPAVVLRSQ